MKVGIRKRSLKSTIKAKTTGKLKRKVKKACNPLYGKKGMGLVNDPKKAIYNKIYNKTTIGMPGTGLSSSQSNNAVSPAAKKGHSILLWLIFGGFVLWIPAVYYIISPKHCWHL